MVYLIEITISSYLCRNSVCELVAQKEKNFNHTVTGDIWMNHWVI